MTKITSKDAPLMISKEICLDRTISDKARGFFLRLWALESEDKPMSINTSDFIKRESKLLKELQEHGYVVYKNGYFWLLDHHLRESEEL